VSSLTVLTSRVVTIAPAELDTPEMDLPVQVRYHLTNAVRMPFKEVSLASA